MWFTFCLFTVFRTSRNSYVPNFSFFRVLISKLQTYQEFILPSLRNQNFLRKHFCLRPFCSGSAYFRVTSIYTLYVSFLARNYEISYYTISVHTINKKKARICIKAMIYLDTKANLIQER